MPSARRRRPLQAAACLAAVAGLAGCSNTAASTSSVTIKGGTLTIYISEPPGFTSNPVQQDLIHAEQLAFAQQSSEVTRYQVRLRVLDKHELSANARTAIEDQSAVAYLGELAPGDSEQSVGITNAQDLLQVSPTDTAVELTQATSAVPGAPKSFYESSGTYGRTFARVVPSSAAEARALVAYMKAHGVSSVFVSNDGSDYGRAIAQAVRAAAATSGLTVASSEAGAGAIFYGAQSDTAQAASAAVQFFDKAASSAPTAKLFGSSSLDTPAFTSNLSVAAGAKLLVTTPGFIASQLPAAGKTFRTTFTTDYGHAPSGEAVFGFAAMSAVLHAIAQAGVGADDRATVVSDVRSIRNLSSVLGTYSMDAEGDTNLDAFVLNRLTGGVLVPVAAAPSQG